MILGFRFKFFSFPIITTEAPPNLSSFKNDTLADFLSKRVLPRKVPNPVPVFETHGTEDDVSWYEGDLFNEDGWSAYLDIPSTIDFFVNQNNLTDVEFSELPDLDSSDGSTIESYIYTSPNSNNEVWLYKVINGGHDWPGSWGNMDVNISEEIWKFFSEMSISEQSFIEEVNNRNQKLIKVIDILGRETNSKNFHIIQDTAVLQNSFNFF